MRIILIVALFSIGLFTLSATALPAQTSLEDYLAGFDYQARKDMKIDSKELVKQYREGKVQLVDIRFKEEFEAWRMGFAINIPLNELPGRLAELDRSKTIVAACPHKDRAIIAMVYLKTKGFEVKYLQDGLVALAEYLRGDKAKELVD
ncbi:rhodanese-like domain-containing protein [Desulfoferrobacter suflitae]|uniref:rhodanese-like domain-containing protein n=1 Tax=Desulfoferrobacter suflitae TaxID=2865782 RepID=UPI002164D4B9|nr:rhodanese-like domain-containing protein [Desulfoferrobacter suflitae]MCK8603767.1 rhodanese-like domain-containing protein [Desulfoferrobacter suflitae]